MITKLGSYYLNQLSENAPGLKEFTTDEYSQFKSTGAIKVDDNEKTYHGLDVLKGWSTVIGAIDGKIYKICIDYATQEEKEFKHLSNTMFLWLKKEMGEPNVKSDSPYKKYIWNSSEGNVVYIVKNVSGYNYIGIFLTSSSVKETFQKKPLSTLRYFIAYALNQAKDYLAHLFKKETVIFQVDNSFTFDKTKFKPPFAIKLLYKKKLNYPMAKQGLELSVHQRESYITGDEFGAYARLERAMKYDPRLPEVRFKSTQSAKMALSIARKLDAMDERGFLTSGYPYIWQDEIGLSNIILSNNKNN
jgi:hypothetical protein